MSTLIYVHGTNGSGKSTLARAVMAAAGGGTGYVPSKSGKEGKAGSTGTARGVYLLGKYETACGGVDGFSPYSHVHAEMLAHSRHPDASVFAEGLLSPGIDTCKLFDSYFYKTVFIALNTPVETCVANVLTRRKRKGNDKVYTPDKLYDKHRSVLRWADRLEAAGLHVQRLEYKKAYTTCLELLGLSNPSVDDLL